MKRALPGLLGLLLVAGPAAAYHDPETPATDYSIYTLKPWELRLGLFAAELGLLESVQVSTYPLFWLVKVKNAQIKWRPWESGGRGVSLELGIFSLDLADFVDEQEAGKDYPQFKVVPFNLVGSSRHDDFTFNAGLSFTWVNFSGTVDSADLEAVGGASTVMFRPAIEYRLSRTFALVAEGRVKIYERYSGRVVTTYTIDADSEVDVVGSAGAEVDGPKGNVGLSAYWSWATFNLRLGLTYGHIAVPVVNVFIPQVSVFPIVDAFWRF
ncbi:MAG: hypothetical protein H6706_23630 [Myxococcales bacterium]|nr:hypothetical protein [Myxococcales bacterium]